MVTGSSLLALTSAPTPTSYPYTGGTAVWPYNYSSTNGHLKLSQSGLQVLGIHQGTAIVSATGAIYVLDNEPVTIPACPSSTACPFGGGTYPSQILPYTVGSGGALQAEPSGVVPDDATLSNPIYLIVESKGKYVYVANQGNNTIGANPEGGIAGYDLFGSPSFQLTFIPDEPFSSGSRLRSASLKIPRTNSSTKPTRTIRRLRGGRLNPRPGSLQICAQPARTSWRVRQHGAWLTGVAVSAV